MQIIMDYNNCPDSAKGAVIALGNFDGVHKGHQAIIHKTIAIATELKAPSAVMTFEPHPVSFFKADAGNFRLTDANKKAQLLEKLGINTLFSINFDKEFSNISAKDFIKEILVNRLNVRHIIIGYDFIFGHNRSGNADTLQEMSAELGYGFTKIDAVGVGEEIFSSTQIRTNLRQGNLTKAKEILGRNFTVSGIVEHGDNRGKSLGFPTINVNTGSLIRPKGGVYAVKLSIENDASLYKAVANIGTKPTFNGTKEEIEVHIFDFDKDIYSKHVEIEFIEYIRPERKFENVEALKLQILSDCKTAREILK